MSSNITITDELVAEIANRLADEGQKVSPVAIWSEVHTGSVVAVAAALRKWRETRAPRVPQVVERPALPETVTDTMRDALDRLWTSAQDEAERAVARRLAAMRQRVEDASNERDDALAELQTTVQELDALQVQLDQMTSAYDEKVDAAAGLEEDIALAVQRTDVAEKRAQELAERVALLEAELESAERETSPREGTDAAGEDESAGSVVETLDAAHAEAVARLESELEAIRAELQAEQEAHAARREEVAGAHAERDAATVDLQNAQAQIATLSASLSDAQERAEGAAASAVESASPAGVDPQELEALKAQITRDAQAHAAAIAEARETVRKWADYSNSLKQQLTQANEKMKTINAQLETQGYRYDENTGAVSKLNTESSPA